MNKTLEEINRKIAELQKAKELIYNEQNNDTIKLIKSLQWTKESELQYIDDGMCSAGIPTYRFDITYDTCPKLPLLDLNFNSEFTIMNLNQHYILFFREV